MLNDISKWMEAFIQCSYYCQDHEMQFKSDFYKIYGNKFLDLQEVVKNGYQA